MFQGHHDDYIEEDEDIVFVVRVTALKGRCVSFGFVLHELKNPAQIARLINILDKHVYDGK